MEEATRKTQVLIEALPYILKFRDRYSVVKYGGSVLRENRFIRAVLQDLVFMSTVGMRVILVHGGGSRISETLAARGIKSEFVNGLRYTDSSTIEIIREVLLEVNGEIRRTIEELGGRTALLDPESRALKAVKLNRPGADLGLVGEISQVDKTFFEECGRNGTIPVVPPVAFGADGFLYNINADTVASQIATALQAEKLVFLSDQPGMMRNRDNAESLISILRPSQARGLIEDGIITAGMIPKVQAALTAISQGVRKVHLVAGHIPHALLLEIFTTQGTGTEIVPEDYQNGI